MTAACSLPRSSFLLGLDSSALLPPPPPQALPAPYLRPPRHTTPHTCHHRVPGPEWGAAPFDFRSQRPLTHPPHPPSRTKLTST